VDLTKSLDLQGVGTHAFCRFQGKVMLGSGANFTEVGTSAFNHASHPDSVVNLEGAGLSAVGSHAFLAFEGSLLVADRYPYLNSVSENSFTGAVHPPVDVDCSSLVASQSWKATVFKLCQE
jgi:hypothetical protein